MWGLPFWCINAFLPSFTEELKKARKVGRTLVPIRVIAETLWMNVEWDGSTRTVYIYE